MKRIIEKIIVGVIVAILLNSGVTAKASSSDALFASRIERKFAALVAMQESKEYLLKAFSKPLVSDERFRNRLENKNITLVGAE